LLRRFETPEERRRETSQAVYANCLHIFLFFFSARKMVICRRSGEASRAGSLSSRPVQGTGTPAPVL
jgi:hypothetical protein